MTRFEFGILGSYNRYKKSPFETYYMGGDGMSGYTTGYATETIGLRGYENGSISNNGYSYSRMTLELRYPLMLQPSTSIYALAFLEGGNAWYSIRDFNPLDMKRSAGFGVRIQLPWWACWALTGPTASRNTPARKKSAAASSTLSSDRSSDPTPGPMTQKIHRDHTFCQTNF